MCLQITHNFFSGYLQLVLGHQRMNLLFGCGMAAEELHSTLLKRFDLGVLIDRFAISEILRSSGILAQVDVAYGRLSGFGIGDVYEFPEAVLLAHGIVEVEQVRWTMQTSCNLDVSGRNTKTEVQAVERVLDVIVKFSVTDGPNIIDLLGGRRAAG